ncbi:MAG: glycosyltransferase [Anaerolineae bacterium]|nr:glycosyltransferase [Anaerolineae bacterium]
MINTSCLSSNTELPEVSICIPAYNSEATISETLDTVLAQDYPRLDVVISDNQSSDNTKTIIQQYADRGVRYCCHLEGRPSWAAAMPNYVGGFANWDFVLNQGRGEYLCLFHSDDLYEPSIVRQQVAIMQSYPNVGAVFTGRLMIDEENRPIRMGIVKLPDDLKGQLKFQFDALLNGLLTYDNFLSTPSVMLRRSVIDTVGSFNERQFLSSADLEMWLRIAYLGYEIAIIDQPLLKYRISKKQWAEQYNETRTDLADIFRVMDYYLSKPDVKILAQSQSLSLYEVRRLADNVLCVMKLLTKGRTVDAKNRMLGLMQWQHVLLALKYPRAFIILLRGLLLYVSTYFGFGEFMGSQIYQVYTLRQSWKREPIV